MGRVKIGERRVKIGERRVKIGERRVKIGERRVKIRPAGENTGHGKNFILQFNPKCKKIHFMR